MKDSRIIFQSVFSSLTNYYAQLHSVKEVNEIVKEALIIAEELKEKYPMQEIIDEPFPDKPVMRDAAVKPCPVCGKFMIPQTEKANEKAPDWKCSDKNCKFSWDKSTHTWIPGQFITGIWNKK